MTTGVLTPIASQATAYLSATLFGKDVVRGMLLFGYYVVSSALHTTDPLQREAAPLNEALCFHVIDACEMFQISCLQCWKPKDLLSHVHQGLLTIARVTSNIVGLFTERDKVAV